MVFLAAQQDAGKDVVNFSAVFICQANYHLSEEVRVEIKIDVFGPVFRRIEQLSTATLFKLQVEKNDVSRVEIIDRQLEKNIVGLFERFVFGQAIVQMLNIVGHVLQQRTKEVKQSFGNSLPQRTFRPQSGVQQA